MIVTKEKQEIINEILNNFKYDRYFETDDFLYWVKEIFVYDGYEVSREEFENIKDYAIKHGKLPSEELKEKLSKIIKNDKEATIYQVSSREKNLTTGTHSSQLMMRYSKKYDNLEIYDYDIDVRATTKTKSDRVLCMRKKTKILSVNSKNFVLIGGNRWLSLKNWAGFVNRAPRFITSEVVKKLLALMIGEKEWVREIEDESIYISNKSSRKANTLDEAIKYECGAKPAKAIKRALLKNTNDIINLYNIIDHKQVHSITNFIKQNYEELDKIFNSPNQYQTRSENLLFLYFLVKDNRCDRNIFIDYIRMLKQEGEKINLNISSYTTIKRNHDVISRQILEKSRDKTRLKISKHYPKIESVPGIEVEMIRSAKRLSQESEMLHHCVHSYKTSINKGSCAIYSLVHKEERYTFEVRAKALPKEKEEDEDRYEFNANQLRGKYNCNPPTSMEKPLLELCVKNNIETKNKIIIFKDKEVKVAGQPVVKKEIKQIGAEILKTLIPPNKPNLHPQAVRHIDEDLPF